MKLYASKAHIWGKNDGCTANPSMEMLIPPMESNEDAKEGIAAHELAYKINTALMDGGANSPDRLEMVGQLTKSGVAITDEMWDSVEVFTNDVYNHMIKAGIFKGEYIGFEETLDIGIPGVAPGKCDAFLYDYRNRELLLWDYKHGRNPVDAFEFAQGILYVKALLEKFNISGIEDRQTTVVIKIIQPRCYKKQSPVDEWRVKASDLRNYFNILEAKADEAQRNPKIKTGPHCGSCNARHTCEAALKCGLNLYEMSFQSMPLNMSNEALSLQYEIVERAIEQLKDLQTAYKEQMEYKLKRGESLPTYGLKPTYSRVNWVKSYEEVKHLGDLLKVDLTKKQLVTPKQAEQLGIDTEVIKHYSDKVQTGVKLSKINTQTAKRIFSK
jgi:hypothetical protein